MLISEKSPSARVCLPGRQQSRLATGGVWLRGCLVALKGVLSCMCTGFDTQKTETSWLVSTSGQFFRAQSRRRSLSLYVNSPSHKRNAQRLKPVAYIRNSKRDKHPLSSRTSHTLSAPRVRPSYTTKWCTARELHLRCRGCPLCWPFFLIRSPKTWRKVGACLRRRLRSDKRSP